MNNYTEQQYAESARKHGITPGPWVWSLSDLYDVGTIEAKQGAMVCDFGNDRDYYPTEGRAPKNADREQILAVPNLLIERDALKAENERLTTAAQNACDALYQWRAAEQTNDSVELENARKSRDAAYDELRAALKGGG